MPWSAALDPPSDWSAGPITKRKQGSMPPSKTGQPEALLEKLLGEASWLLSHAEALGDLGSKGEADAELGRAASCEEQAASLLDAAGREREAVIHRVSAA